MTDEERILNLFRVLQQGPTSAELDYLVGEYTFLGRLAAMAEFTAEDAEAERKHQWATEYSRIKQSAEKVTDTYATAQADINTYEWKKREVKAYEAARKLKNLLNATEQAINAVKYLGRQTDAPVTFAGRK